MLNDLKRSRAQVISEIDELNKLDQDYFADPDQKKFAQALLGKDKSSYSFDEDLLPLDEKILEEKKILLR